MRYFLSILLVFLAMTASTAAETSTYTYEIVDTYPHDQRAFTQGFTYYDGDFYEGTGLKGHSSLRRVDPETGDILQLHQLPDKYFGEGITIFKDRIYQLTWKAGVGFVYNLDFEQIDQFKYKGEGWGLTHNQRHLIMSDGSATLSFLDPSSLSVDKKLEVTRNGQPLSRLNELEYIEGEIYANIWGEDYLVTISPESGEVTGVIDLEGIIDPDDYDHNLDVLNGIAHDPRQDRLFVTGKLWPLIFEIEIVPDTETRALQPDRNHQPSE